MIWNKIFDNKDLPKALLRYGLGVVLLYFGFSQIFNPTDWSGLVPGFVNSIISASDFVFYNGIFEIIFATLLILGIYTRVVAAILTIHLAIITAVLGFIPSGVRDFGLTVASLVTFLDGRDKYCLENKWRG